MNTNSTKSNESGMVLIFVIASIFTLIVLLGLFLDVGTMMIAKRDREKTARLVSSEAISVFNRAKSTNPQTRGIAAQKAGQELANTNLNLQFAKTFFANPNADQDIGLLNRRGNTGSLLPGSWFFNPTGVFDDSGNCKYSGNPCPCQGNKWNGPCFRPLTGWNDKLKNSVNAFSTNLYTANSNKLKTTFMGIVGQKEVSLNTQSTIAIRPLNVVVLVDLSRFVDEETHVPYDVVGLGVSRSTISERFNPARFAYELDKTTTPSCKAENNTMVDIVIPENNTIIEPELSLTCKRDPSSDPSISGNDSFWNRWVTSCKIKGGDHIADSWYNSAFNWPTKSTPATMFHAQRQADYSNFYHTKLDYRCLNMNFKRRDGTNNTNIPYLIDLRRTLTYKGPEPLNTFIEATRASIQKIKDRNLRGDSISVIGFDWDAEISKRRIGPLNPIENTRFKVDLEDVFKDPYVDGTSNHYATLKSQYQKSAFIPRDGNRYLSIPYALNEAYTILKARANFATADNMIVLLTTGLSNCYKITPEGNAPAQTCGQDAIFFDKSIKEAIKYSNDKLAKQGILLHTIIRTPRVQPVSKLMKTGGACYIEDNSPGLKTQDQYNFQMDPDPLKQVTPLDKQTGTFSTTNGLNITNPFTLPNNLAQASLATGGVWAPIRPSCPGADKATCLANFKTAKDNYCADSTNITPNVIDADGNILCDPSCSNPSEQTTTYINRMFDLTPLLPVGEGVVVSATN